MEKNNWYEKMKNDSNYFCFVTDGTNYLESINDNNYIFTKNKEKAMPFKIGSITKDDLKTIELKTGYHLMFQAVKLINYNK